jgi:CBS domain-containing protein
MHDFLLSDFGEVFATAGRAVRALVAPLAPQPKRRAPRLVAEIMRPPVAIPPDATVQDARDIAQETDVDALLVMVDECAVGVLSIWDLVDVHPGLTVASILEPSDATVTSGTTIREAARMLREGDHPCLAVADGGVVSGFVTREDFRAAGLAPRELEDPSASCVELGEGD